MPDRSIGGRVAETWRNTLRLEARPYDAAMPTLARAIDAAIAADRQERCAGVHAMLRDREAEILRLRTSEHGNAQAIDRLGQFLGIPLGERVPADVVAAAEKRVAELVGLLDELQWTGAFPNRRCPCCTSSEGRENDGSHYEDCRLAAAIKEAQ